MSYSSYNAPDPLVEQQNYYDEGWWDGIQFGLTMKDINNDIFPEDGQWVLILLGNMFIVARYTPLICQENGTQFYQRLFVTEDGKQFVPGYVRYWMPLPIIPNDNTN